MKGVKGKLQYIQVLDKTHGKLVLVMAETFTEVYSSILVEL